MDGLEYPSDETRKPGTATLRVVETTKWVRFRRWVGQKAQELKGLSVDEAELGQALRKNSPMPIQESVDIARRVLEHVVDVQLQAVENVDRKAGAVLTVVGALGVLTAGRTRKRQASST